MIDGYSDFVFTNQYGNVHNPETINRAIRRIYTAYNEQEKEQAKKEQRKPMLIRHFHPIRCGGNCLSIMVVPVKRA